MPQMNKGIKFFFFFLQTVAQDEDLPSCLLAQRYKTLHKYEYQYEAESLNAINGASQLKNGPKASCKVEIEVPQTCSFIIRTTGCVLSEVVGMDAEGNPEFTATPTFKAFAEEMEKYPLKVVVEGVNDVKLYPEEGETTNILNFKRGIVSALAVPLVEEDKNKYMPTIHGKCKTYYTINAREDIATDMTLNRDLSGCDKFIPIKDHTSPLALISGMHYPLSKMVRSSQTCNYKFDNEKKHMTSGSCTENHILIPFSHKGEYGVTNVGKQELTLVEVSAHNDRVFDLSKSSGLHIETVEDKYAVQDKDAALNILRELATLSEADGEKRAHLFHVLVYLVRGMKTETLSPAIPEALEVSRVLTYQVLAQCGTPQCSSAIMQILRSFDSASLEVDASVFALGLMSNPSELLINDMLEMAKYKSSKPIMYALSNVVKRFYKAEEKLTPEIFSVAEFMAGKLGDCSGDNDETFMTLRVIGNMAPALVNAGPALRGAVMQCVNQPAASPAVQQAAIQVFRLTPAPEEVREVFMQVLLDGASPMQKRIAAYLVLMKDPQTSELTQLVNALPTEQDQQVKSFVISHLTNILSSTVPETLELRQRILEALQGNDIEPTMDPTKFSRNYKIGSLEGNMLFDSSSYLPKEVMLDMTLKAFGFDIDMMEIGMEGKGFEPTVEALFGENGFFPDTVMKTIYFVSDNMPEQVSEMLQNIVPALKRNRMKRQAHMNFMRDIGRNLNKLVRDLKDAQSPEAMVYMRLLGNELGYLRTNEMEEMAYSLVMMIDSMFKMFPTDIMKALMTKADNTIFAHYIFMDNEFFLPTMTGVPLRVALSGTFTPGLKGGLQMARDMSKITFMPSAGAEFVTQVGSYFPEYVHSGLEMQTNFFHESGLTAEIAMARDNIKLTIPAPTTPTKFITMTNSLVAVVGSEIKTIPALVMEKVDVTDCSPVFAGMKYCTSLQYTDAFTEETAPYFPFTGDSKFSVELHPTGEVTEYTATVSYEVLRMGEEGRQKVDSVKVILRAEGADPTEARVALNYNRRKNVITADILIPDYDVEAGLRLGVVDGNTKGKGTHSISLDFINKNIPQLSLVGRANLKEMKEGMLEVQLLVPSLKSDATFTAHMKRGDELELDLQSIINFLGTTSKQTVGFEYDSSKMEVKFKSDVNSEILNNLPVTDLIDKYGNDLLDMPVGDTDMKVRQIFKGFVEAMNNYLEKYGADFPYIQNFRVPDMPEITLPETLFMNVDTKVVYFFNPKSFTIVLPLPLGGKSAEELNFPPALTTPQMSVPQLGLEIVSIEVPVPDFVIPERLSLTIPYFGKAEVEAAVESNLYNMDASVMVGKEDMEVAKYSAKFDVKGTSPIDILSVKMEGSGMLDATESIKAELKSSLTHKLLEASVTILEDASITDKISLKSNSKVEVTSPLGLNVVLEHTGMAGINTEEISADNNFEGSFKAGPIFGKTVSTQTFAIFPLRPEAKIDSSVQLDSTILKAQNTIAATFANGEVSVVSNTNAYEDVLTHVIELSFKDGRLSLKSDANALALGMKIRNQAEASTGLSEVIVRIETNADQSENRVYSLLTASFDSNGLALNSDANMKIFENEATHKAALTLNKDGLATSGTTTLQSIVSLENTFSGGLDATKATLSITNKGAMQDIKIDNANTLTITLSSLDFDSKADVIVSEYATYTHDITFDMKPFTASANLKNNLQLLAAEFINEAQLQAELYKMDLTGSLKAIYAEEELKHTYQVSYADMTATAKCSTTGKLLGTHMNQNTEVEIIGLAARITNDARFNSQPIRIDHTIRCSIVPFDFNLDAIFNGDGDLTMYGKHSAQLYGKFLLRAQPLAFSSSHECRASVTQQLDNGFTLETTADNKMETALSFEEQRTNLKLKFKVNENTLSQEFSVYNTAERTGVEGFGTILTNILNTDSEENQEYTISGFLKYDKNTDSHIIHFPLIDSLPVVLDSLKGLVVRAAEALQEFINNDEVRARIATLPQYVNDIVAEVNIEEKITQLKQYFSDFTQDFVITMDDVEASLRNLKATVERLLSDLTVYIQQFVGMVKDAIASSTFPETFMQNFQDLLTTINEDYDIKAMVLSMIDTFRDMISQFDLEKLKGSSIAFLSDIDAEYEIKVKLEAILGLVRDAIDSFDIAEIKNYITSLDFKAFIEDLVSKIPTETLTEIMDFTKEMIEELDIIGKINNFFTKMREMIVKFDVEQKVQAVFDKVVELIQQFRIKETISALIQMIKDADIPTKFMSMFQDVINYLKTTEIEEIIQQLNMYIETTLEKVKSLDDFVDVANQYIAEYTSYINELIKTLEIPQKLAATRDFVNMVLSTVRGFLVELREMKVAEMIKSVKDVFDWVVLDNLRTFAEVIKEKISNFDVKAEISSLLNFMSKFYTRLLRIITNVFTGIVETVKTVMPDQKILSEIQQIINGLLNELMKAEINMPSFTIPLTDLDVPSMTLNLETLKQFEMPTQVDIPEFTILGSYTVNAITISIDDIKQKILDLIDFIVNFEIKMFDWEAFFGDMTLNYIPALPEIILPEILLSDISLPTIPQVPVEKLVQALQVPDIKLPTIPSELMIPAFGKLYGEIKFLTPIYTMKTSAEVQNSTETEMTPQFTGFFSSQGTSPSFEVFNYKVDSTARLAIPKWSRIVVAETLKLNHQVLGVEHQASVTLYGLSAQAQAKTTVKFDTAPYTANFMNTAFIAMEGGISASLDTTVTQVVDLPIFNVKNEFTATQKSVLRQDGYTITLTADNSGTGKFNAETGNHNSKLILSLTPTLVSMTFNGDTDSSIMKMKQQINAELRPITSITFSVRNEAEGPFIKNSLLVVSGLANLYDLKAELKANHDAELYGPVSGVLSNGVNFIIRPIEFVFEFQNKGNAKVNILDSLTGKIDLQNDYSVNFKPESQQVNTVALVRLNQYKIFYNFTMDNNVNEASILAAMESEANLDFLKSPISIPEIDLPFVDFHTPAISDLNLYEQAGLDNILTTTDQTLDVDAKIVYKKSQAVPLVSMMGLTLVPSVGNLITELSFKSAIINLNVNAGLYTEDDLVLRLGAVTASVFEGLNAKLDGTTSLTTKRGIKLANSMSLENRHIEGTHDSTFSVSTDTFETAVSVNTVAKVALPVLSLEASQNLVADNKNKATAVSTWMMKGNFNLPLIKIDARAEADHSLKLEGTFEYVSMESSTKANIDGTIFEDYLLVGVMDNEATLYLNKDGLRSTSKIIADGKLNHGTDKIIGMDVNENLAIEASLSRVYVVLKYTGSNDVNMFDFFTNGKHIAQATIDFVPVSSLTADIEIDFSQPTNFGDFTIFEKTVADITGAKQKISANGKVVSPLYTTDISAELEGIAPVFKVILKSSATSPIVLLEYNMDASTTANFENEALTMITKATLTHTDVNMEINHIISQALSASRHTLNVDITSATFADMNLRYAARRDGISASVSSPSAGFLGLQLSGRVPLTARFYGRYPSAPDADVDILVIKSTAMDDMLKLQIAYNLEAPKEVLSELKMKLPSITAAVKAFADKYQITTTLETVKDTLINYIADAYNAVVNYDAQMSQLSVFFRNVIVQYQKTVQVFLDAAIKVLRETQFKMPGSDEMTTLPEVLKKLTSSIAAMLEVAIKAVYDNMEVYYNSFVDMISSVKLRMPVGDAINGAQVIEQIKVIYKTVFDELVDFVKNMESLDTMLEKLGETLKAVVDKSQEFVDSVKSDYLDAVLVPFNAFYLSLVTSIKNVVDQLPVFSMEEFNKACETIMDMFIQVAEKFNSAVSGLLADSSAYIKLADGNLEIDLPFSFQQ
uniref:Vitellogenin domain-containing protein n=1 Tax=Salarias fasciatus TaxID=181472 RepID=A0A672GNZ2_SALFA